MSSDPASRPGQPEFIILIALLISMVALDHRRHAARPCP
jgi:hypothetical protein